MGVEGEVDLSYILPNRDNFADQLFTKEMLFDLD